MLVIKNIKIYLIVRLILIMYDDLIYLNSSYLLKLKPKKYFIILLTIIFIILLFIFSLIKECYDVKKFTGYVTCEEVCKVDISLRLDEVSKIKDAIYLELDNKKINIIDKEISNVLVDKNNNANYQIISYKIDNHNLENLFYDTKVYYNKEIILKKLIKMLIESG